MSPGSVLRPDDIYRERYHSDLHETCSGVLASALPDLLEYSTVSSERRECISRFLLNADPALNSLMLHQLGLLTC